MSSLLNIPKRILAKLYELEKKIVTFPFADKIRRKRLRIGDILENRELIVVDKYGNHYYQYYSYQGLPTKRMVHFLVKKVHLNMYAFNKWHDEPLMLSWLQMRELIAPFQEDLERRYVDQENFERNALEWDKKEKLQIDEYKRRREFSLGRDRKETGAKGIGEEYSPGIWDKKQLVQVKSEGKI